MARDRELATVTGGAALAFSLLFFASDLVEAAQGGFSDWQLVLTLIAEAAIPFFVWGLYLCQRPRIGRLGLFLSVSSGFRSDAEQQVLWNANPNPKWVAPPGTSLHRYATELAALADQGGALDLGLDAVDQVVVGITEGLHALVFERPSDPVQVQALRGGG